MAYPIGSTFDLIYWLFLAAAVSMSNEPALPILAWTPLCIQHIIICNLTNIIYTYYRPWLWFEFSNIYLCWKKSNNRIDFTFTDETKVRRSMARMLNIVHNYRWLYTRNFPCLTLPQLSFLVCLYRSYDKNNTSLTQNLSAYRTDILESYDVWRSINNTSVGFFLFTLHSSEQLLQNNISIITQLQ